MRYSRMTAICSWGLFVLAIFHATVRESTAQGDLLDPSQFQAIFSRALQDDGVVNPSLLLHQVLEDPLPIPDFNVSTHGSLTSFEGQFKTLQLKGLKGLQLKKILINVGHMNVSVEMHVPALRIEGLYDLQGSVTFMNIDGGGDFWMNVTDLKALGGAALDNGPQGLKVKDVHVDANVDDIQLHFDNLLGGGGWSTFTNALLNKASGLIFDQVRSLMIDELKGTIEKEINVRLKEIPAEFLTPNSNNTIFDDILVQASEHLKLMGAEPLHLPDMDETFNKRMLFVETSGTFRMNDGILHGLSTLHRTGDIIIDYENNSIAVIASLGFHNLTCSYNWHANFMGIGPSGKLTLSMNQLSAFLSIQQELKTGSRPRILDLKLDRIGQVWMDVDGLGTLDFLLEIVINLVSNALKHSIAQAVLSPVRDAVQFQLDNFPIEFLTASA